MDWREAVGARIPATSSWKSVTRWSRPWRWADPTGPGLTQARRIRPRVEHKDDMPKIGRELKSMGSTTNLPGLQDFPRLLSKYRWDDHHAAFGWSPDCLDTGFPWIVSLEDRFQAAMEHNGFPPLTLVSELILWGGNQNNILKKFSKDLRAKDYETFIHSVVESLDDPPLALESAMSIKGFGRTYGSKLLRFCRPRDYGALDSRILGALKSELGASTAWTPTVLKQYSRFLDIVHEYQRGLHTAKVLRPSYGARPASTEWTAAEIEMALFAWASSQS